MSDLKERRDEIDAQLFKEFGEHFWNDGDNRTKRETALAKSSDDFRKLVNDCIAKLAQISSEERVEVVARAVDVLKAIRLEIDDG